MLMRLDILQKRIRRLEVAEKIDAAIEEYYTKKRYANSSMEDAKESRVVDTISRGFRNGS